jgi:hypothetical protein
MKNGRIHFEQLLGKLVRDADGVKAGRILSVRAELEGEDCVVRDYGLGASALMSRLGISMFQRLQRPPLRVPWEQLDLSDPERPRLRCTVAELKTRT